MKTPSSKTRPRPVELNLTSMIDVIFLLLIFFVLTSDFKEPEKLLPTNLSASGAVASPETLPQERRDLGEIKIRIAFDGTPEAGVPALGAPLVWRVDDRRLESLAELESTLAALQEIDPDVPVIVAPERNVPIESALDAYDAARRVGLNKIKFAASPEALAQTRAR